MSRFSSIVCFLVCSSVDAFTGHHHPSLLITPTTSPSTTTTTTTTTKGVQLFSTESTKDEIPTRRSFLEQWVVVTAGTVATMTTNTPLANADENRPDSLDIDNFLRTGE